MKIIFDPRLPPSWTEAYSVALRDAVRDLEDDGGREIFRLIVPIADPDFTPKPDPKQTVTLIRLRLCRVDDSKISIMPASDADTALIRQDALHALSRKAQWGSIHRALRKGRVT